ncbi:MAG: hypothetical protein ACREC6_02895 [Hyphomicrobiaceae bacterium]
MTTLTKLMRPRHFLLLGGTILVTIGLAGVMGLLSSISRASVFNPPYWINWVHLTFGIFVLAIVFAGNRTLQSAITFAAAVMGSTLGLSGLLLGSYAAKRYDMPELADPSDHLAHLTVGALALWAWSNRKVGHRSSERGASDQDV